MEIALLISRAMAVAEQRGERLDVGTIRNATDVGIARFGMALAKEPNDVRGYLHLARMLVKAAAVTGEPRYLAFADEILRIGVQHVPRCSLLHYWRGTVALTRGQHEQAMRHGEDAVRLSPTLGRGWTLLERVYRLRGEEAKAESARARASALSRESWNP
jgi:Flp pilus assembly protein TadD